MEVKSSYRQIIKSTSILGSSQLINVVLGVVRSKLTAVFLGTMGVGIFGLLQSVIDLTRSFSGLGLDSGATRDLATTNLTDEEELGKTLYTINIWYLATAILGALICIVFAHPLSFWAFESYDYTFYIVALSAAVFFTALAAGITASLQGLRKITYMALVSTINSIVTLLIMIPIYYFWRMKGIIPMIIIASLTMFLISLFFYRKLKIKPIRIPTKEVIRKGKTMLQLGIYLVVAGILSTGSLFIVRASINRAEGIDNVGLFQAAWVITTLVWGIVLRSTNTDFYPKLCSLIEDKPATKQFVNEQTYIILLIISPLIIGLVTFSSYVLQILYTSDFLEATNMLRWHLIGAFFKIAITPIATIMLAKNRGGVHLFCEIVFWSTYLLASYFLFPIYNLEALGLAYLLAYLVYVPTVLITGYNLAKATWNNSVIKLMFINLAFMAGLYISIKYCSQHSSLIGSAILLLSSLLSLYHIKNLISIDEIIEWISKRTKK